MTMTSGAWEALIATRAESDLPVLTVEVSLHSICLECIVNVPFPERTCKESATASQAEGNLRIRMGSIRFDNTYLGTYRAPSRVCCRRLSLDCSRDLQIIAA